MFDAGCSFTYALTPGLCREVQMCESAVVLLSSAVVSIGGVGLMLEVAEVVGSSVALYLGGPFFQSFVPVDAFVF